MHGATQAQVSPPGRVRLKCYPQWAGLDRRVACRYASLFNEHAIAVGIETVFLFDRMAVGVQHTGGCAERAYQHEQSGLGEMEVRQQRAHHTEIVTGVNEKICLSAAGLQSAFCGLVNGVF